MLGLTILEVVQWCVLAQIKNNNKSLSESPPSDCRSGPDLLTPFSPLGSRSRSRSFSLFYLFLAACPRKNPLSFPIAGPNCKSIMTQQLARLDRISSVGMVDVAACMACHAHTVHEETQKEFHVRNSHLCQTISIISL